MAKLVKVCEKCGKKASEKSHFLSKHGFRIVTLDCGHSYTEKLLEKKDWEKVEALFGAKDHLYKYQGEGYEFARASNFRCLIADEPGVGKTVQTLVCLLLHREELTPTLITVKSALQLQYLKQGLRWLGPDFAFQILNKSTDKPCDLFDIHITTYDVLWRMSKRQIEAAEKAEQDIRIKYSLQEFEAIPEHELANVPSIDSPFKSYPYKCVILDECQQIKNPLSKRAQQVREICKTVPHILASSGTPIKNHAGEYFTILNILKPERFRNYSEYCANYCDQYWNGRAYKVGGLRDVEWFKQRTNDFIIRRTKAEVLPDLPTLNRQFTHCEFANAKIEAEYDAMAEEFSDFYYENEHEADAMTNILAKMAKLRHKSGINKVPFTAEFVVDFLMDTDRKMVVFTHHLDVAEMLRNRIIALFEKEDLTDINEPLMFASGNSEKRQAVIDAFMNNPADRVMIASTLAAGEGVDGLQSVCEDCILMERQWNPANEEQVEGRFIRIGAKEHGSVSANYILTTGTIDEYFTELVEQKRAIMSQTLDGTSYDFNQTSLMKELALTLAQKGAKKWRLK